MPPIAHHLAGDLAGVADWPGLHFYDLVPTLARAALRVLRLIFAHTPTGVACLALLHDPLSDSVVDRCSSASGFTLGRFGSSGGASA